MADVPSPAQIRGARAMLDWSLVDLAKAARVSVSTARRMQDAENGLRLPRELAAIQDALETEGVRFLPDDGTGAGIRLTPR